MQSLETAQKTGMTASVHYHGAAIEVVYFKRDSRSDAFYSVHIGDLSLMVDLENWGDLLEALRSQGVAARNDPQ